MIVLPTTMHMKCETNGKFQAIFENHKQLEKENIEP